MEALTCGNTEIAPQDLRISINKLSRTASPSKNTGFGAEFKVNGDYLTFHLNTMISQ